MSDPANIAPDIRPFVNAIANEAVRVFEAAIAPAFTAAHTAAADAETEVEGLRAALGLALAILGRNEPPDSRAVSDEFVAMAAVHSGTWDSACLATIEEATARVQALPAPEAPEIIVTTE